VIIPMQPDIKRLPPPWSTCSPKTFISDPTHGDPGQS